MDAMPISRPEQLVDKCMFMELHQGRSQRDQHQQQHVQQQSAHKNSWTDRATGDARQQNCGPINLTTGFPRLVESQPSCAGARTRPARDVLRADSASAVTLTVFCKRDRPLSCVAKICSREVHKPRARLRCTYISTRSVPDRRARHPAEYCTRLM